ncbi:MAG: ATP-binding cassette domain-containing protein [Halanaerobiales bacterium]
MPDKKLLEIKDLNLELDRSQILKNMTMQINRGEVFALIGPNGCGKSSLAYTIMGLSGYQPQSGSIMFKDEEINNLSTDQRAQRGLTLAWQEPARFEGVSVRKFLSLGLKSQGKEATEAKLEWALRRVAIVPDKYLDRMIDDTLSGGERKRIELASILLMAPDLVILDEPDSGVDVVALNNIEKVIKDFKENEIGVMLITHSEEILELADRAALVCNGEIIKRGDPTEISEYFKFECLACEDEDYRKHLGVSQVG